jgi:LuxR family maltose regulon positive regulatory protein
VAVAATARVDPPTVITIALLHAGAAIGRQDGKSALAAVAAARPGPAGWGPYALLADLLTLATGAAHLVLGDPSTARRCLDAMTDSPERSLLLARILAAESRPDEALEVLRGLPARPRPRTLQHAALLAGRLCFEQGDLAGAIASLRQALDYGRRERARRPVAEAGGWVRQVLRHVPGLAAEHEWLYADTDSRGAEEAVAVVTPESLTERETEVLGRLAQAMSTEEIARTLYLSINTVKTHLKSIYRKLGASGRSAAARRARELKLLPVEGELRS